MSIGKICTREVELADPDEPVLDAALRMKREDVGTLVVLDAERKPLGLVTDRDLVLRVLAEGRDARTTRVREVMTPAPKSVSAESPIEEALARMGALRVRRMPVVDPEGCLVGLVSVDDALALLAGEIESLRRILEPSGPRKVVAARPEQRRVRRFSGLERAASDMEC